MNEKQKNQLRENLLAYGGETWTLLLEAYDNKEFSNSLTKQEKNSLQRLPSVSANIAMYADGLSDVLFKYITWANYEQVELPRLKKEIRALSSKIKENTKNLQTIEDSAKYIGGATILVEYSKSFSETSRMHNGNSKRNATFYISSLALFFLVSVLIFTASVADIPYIRAFIADDISELPYNIGFFSLKVALLIFTFQITQFFRKNYNAEKHLEEVYRHRSDVLQSLHAVYNSIENPDERDQILKAGTLFAYDRGETGYITTKEGAGSGDDVVSAILSSLTR